MRLLVEWYRFLVLGFEHSTRFTVLTHTILPKPTDRK